MSKVALLGDMHWGARGDSEVLHSHFMRFVNEVFIPALLEREVTKVIQLGDFFDKRKSINFLTLSKALEFVRLLKEAGIELTVLVGNHDTYFKNTLEINSPEYLLQQEGVLVIHEPTNFDGDIFIVPWICDENRQEIMRRTSLSSHRFCIGHFEFAGFQMYRGIECEHGDDHKAFSKFDRVFSGHFHTPSVRDNIVYVGTPYDIVWSDHGDRKGFLILDTDTGETEFVENPNKLHVLIDWINGVDKFPEVTDKYVKIKVIEDDDSKRLEKFLKVVAEKSPAQLAVIDTRAAAEETLDFEGVSEKDPITALTDEIKILFDGEQLQSLLEKSNELYTDALTSVEEM